MRSALRSPRPPGADRWQLLAWLWAPIVGLAVVATGNHFVADIAAGVAITVAGYGIGRVASRRLGLKRVEPTRRMGFEPAFDLK